jgi:hypothetical protein
MQVLFYAKDKDENPVFNAVENLFPGVEAYGAIGDFSGRFRYPLDHLTIAVLVAATGSELMEISALRNLLSDVRVILILPNRDAETVHAGHALHPRFMSYIDSDVSIVTSVLRKMLSVPNPRAQETDGVRVQ